MASTTDPVIEMFPLGMHWPTLDPFLFCAHHNDTYPAGTAQLAPAASLSGRQIGMDFSGLDGWSMYHGSHVPGFPQHPHRGFETISYMRSGYMDHSDSLGAAARFGAGDVQWMTAGSGIVHAEMFPLLRSDQPNPLELFQIWLNLPAADKLVEPHFSMLWSGDIPTVAAIDDAGREVSITVIAGTLDGHEPPAPPPHSWAARLDTDIAIWQMSFAPGASWVLPPAEDHATTRTVYAFDGGSVTIDGTSLYQGRGAVLRSDLPATMTASGEGIDCMLLQGRPIGEPVAQHGPFVMNIRSELQQAFVDYQSTQFGGWPWATSDPDHGVEFRRFANRPDGSVETP